MTLRICLYTWLAEQIKTTKVPPRLPKELNLLALGLYKSLEDRNPDVRTPMILATVHTK